MQVGSKTVKQWKLQELCSCYLFISYSRVNYNFHTFVLFGGIIIIIMVGYNNYYKDGKLTLMSQCVVPFSLIIIYCGSNKERLQNKKKFAWCNCFGFFFTNIFWQSSEFVYLSSLSNSSSGLDVSKSNVLTFCLKKPWLWCKKNLTNREGVVL